ncbi:MAG: hypothetical protein RH951_07800, partial [Parvibaculum sp.]
ADFFEAVLIGPELSRARPALRAARIFRCGECGQTVFQAGGNTCRFGKRSDLLSCEQIPMTGLDRVAVLSGHDLLYGSQASCM